VRQYEEDRFGTQKEMKTFFENYSRTLSDERKIEIQKKYSKLINI
jgi:hypothetical protein